MWNESKKTFEWTDYETVIAEGRFIWSNTH